MFQGNFLRGRVAIYVICIIFFLIKDECSSFKYFRLMECIKLPREASLLRLRERVVLRQLHTLLFADNVNDSSNVIAIAKAKDSSLYFRESIQSLRDETTRRETMTNLLDLLDKDPILLFFLDPAETKTFFVACVDVGSLNDMSKVMEWMYNIGNLSQEIVYVAIRAGEFSYCTLTTI